jgi:O-succinylbenzoic acid--CoA ligase
MFRIPFSSLTEDELRKHATEKLTHNLRTWEKEIWLFIRNWLNPSIVTIKVTTSGSTGVPKVIEHGKGAMLNSTRMTCDALQLKQGNKVLLCLPADKISGMMIIVRSIWAKMDLYCIRPSVNPLRDIPDTVKFDFAAFTPMQLFDITSDEKKRERIEKIKKVIIGGEEIPALLLESLLQMKNQAYATFAMTETVSHIALRRLNGTNPENQFTTLSGIKVSADERGCLIIHAPELGIRNLVTNDEVYLVSSTQFNWLGRKDNLINSGGLKIFPEQIEEQLKPVLEIPFFITAIPSARSGQEVAIAVESKNFGRSEANNLKKLFISLSKIQCPKAILTIPHFIRTDNGKIRRKESLKNVSLKIAL